MLLGKSILVSILDLLQINPYSRMGVSDYDYLDNLRKTIAQKIFTECEKYRLREKINLKYIREISSTINNKYYRKRFESYKLTVDQISLKER